jgi:transcriptional regulator with XRE-family HTH domain
MPRPNKSLTQREKEICERFQIARKEIVKWSQFDLAKEAGVTMHQLVNIEYKRAPLRLKVAKFLCEKFDISQRWLALGILPIHPRYEVSMDYAVKANKDHVFSSYFDEYLDYLTGRIEKAVIEKIGEDNFRNGRFDDAAFADTAILSDPPGIAMSLFVKKLVALRLNTLPDVLQIEYASELLQVSREFQRKHSKQLAGTGTTAAKENPKKPVDNLTLSAKSEDVKHSMSKLLERLKKATAEHGQKTVLAKHLGVPPVSVSQWLSGVKEPGGETTLKLLNWVELQERQK